MNLPIVPSDSSSLNGILTTSTTTSTTTDTFSPFAQKPTSPTTALPSVFSLLPTDFAALGYRGDAVNLFSRIQRIATWENGTPVLGKEARELLLSQYRFTLPDVVESITAQDGATRYALRFAHDAAPNTVEAVHMPRAVKNPRTTLCISSQVGCAMGCTFCATATMGLVRNLSAGDIVSEVLRLMIDRGPTSGHQLNLVFMGMGEPLHNLKEVARAVEILCHPMGVGMSPQRITVSTSGLVPGIEELATINPRPLLAISVNSTENIARSRVMPVNRAYPLEKLRETLLKYPFRPREKVTLEYVMLADVNDTDDDAVRLADFAQGLRHNINLIPMNEHALSAFKAPSEEKVQHFTKILMERGCFVTTRANRARDVRGACGQLVQEGRKNRPQTPVS